VFGRRKREQEEAAREAERRAVCAELAKRPESICPFLGMAGSRTGYQESVSEEHRCYAFGDPAELSAEQQQKVCLQPGYGNCPRYLRGVLVIPTEELEALRHPQPVPQRPVPVVAAKSEPKRGRGGLIATVVLLLLIVGVAGGGAYWYLRNNVPSSAVTEPLPGGTEVSAELLNLSEPEDGSQHLTAVTDIIGTAAAPDTTLVYVIDLSITTLQGPGCGGDRNNDGLENTPLDCEIAAATALNAQAVESGTVAEVGLVGFAEGATTADLAADGGAQVLVPPGQDDDSDDTPNVVEAMQSAYSAHRGNEPVGFRVFSPVETTTQTTAFSAGLQAACDVMAESQSPIRLAVFLSDGLNRGGDLVSSVVPCDTPATFQTFAVGADSSCEQDTAVGGLQEIADLTDGICTAVVDLTRLPAILESVVLPQIVRIQLAIDGDDPIDISQAASPSLPAATSEEGQAEVNVNYPIPALTDGEHEICMTVFASDAGGAGEVETCATVDAGGGRLTSN